MNEFSENNTLYSSCLICMLYYFFRNFLCWLSNGPVWFVITTLQKLDIFKIDRIMSVSKISLKKNTLYNSSPVWRAIGGEEVPPHLPVEEEGHAREWPPSRLMCFLINGTNACSILFVGASKISFDFLLESNPLQRHTWREIDQCVQQSRLVNYWT